MGKSKIKYVTPSKGLLRMSTGLAKAPKDRDYFATEAALNLYQAKMRHPAYHKKSFGRKRFSNRRQLEVRESGGKRYLKPYLYSKGARINDLLRIASKTRNIENSRHMLRPDRSDVRGVDAPPYSRKYLHSLEKKWRLPENDIVSRMIRAEKRSYKKDANFPQKYLL